MVHVFQVQREKGNHGFHEGLDVVANDDLSPGESKKNRFIHLVTPT